MEWNRLYSSVLVTDLIQNTLSPGVATFCKDSATPVAAEEGLSGVFASQNGDVGCYGNMDEFTQEELRVLDSEGRAVLTQHKIW